MRPDSDGPLSAQDVAYRRLRAMIVDNRLTPGTPLKAAVLAEEIGVSATPIREALIRLAADGLVVWRQNRGAIVAPFSAREVRQVYQVRSVLEGLAARLAAENADESLARRLEAIVDRMAAHLAAGAYRESVALNRDFHGAIHEQCGNPELLVTLRVFWDRAQRFRNLAVDLTSHLEAAHRGHVAILDAVRGRRPDEAERLAREHVLATSRAVAAYIDASWGRRRPGDLDA
ncbi:MAG TPA: GntR family transcriptional regulator [Thermodesulfobacteriota bacterium]